MARNILLIILLFFWTLHSIQSSQYFDVNLDRCEIVQQDKRFTDWKIKVKNYNKTTRALYGNITIFKPIGDDYTIEALFYRKQGYLFYFKKLRIFFLNYFTGNEYRKLKFQIEQSKFCKAFGDDPYVYKDLSKKSNFPEDIKANCPLKAGFYRINGATFPLDDVPQHSFPSNHYMIEMVFRNYSHKFLQVRFYTTIYNND